MIEGPSNILPADGEVLYYPSFFSRGESDAFLLDLLSGVGWSQEPIKIFGKAVMQPRLTAWYGDDGKTYSYSGITMRPHSWTPTLRRIKEKIEAVSQAQFTSALLNQYRDEKDSVGWHRDNEKELGKNPVIGSVSFGASRAFHLRHCTKKDLRASVTLAHGSFLLMRGVVQHHWLHSIPKSSTATGCRINITFRTILGTRKS